MVDVQQQLHQFTVVQGICVVYPYTLTLYLMINNRINCLNIWDTCSFRGAIANIGILSLTLILTPND